MFLPRFLALLIFSVFLFSVPVYALEKGDRLPHDLAAKDQAGAEQNFESVKGEKGAVLVFVRSADWCPYCQAQLIDLADKGGEIDALGYSVVTVSYDDPEVLAAFADKYAFEYTMLSDLNSEIIKAFGILNEEMEPDSDYYGVPHPTIYVVNAQGIIQAVLAEEGYKTRPPVEQIIAAIKGH